MSENDYFNTATEDLKETMHPEKWKAGKDRSSDSFEEALVGKELSRYETLKARPGLTERYVPAEKIVAKQGDEIALQVGNNEYVRIQEALSIDNGRGCIIFLDPEKDYASYHPDENNTIRTPTGNISGKQLSAIQKKLVEILYNALIIYHTMNQMQRRFLLRQKVRNDLFVILTLQP